MDTKTTETLRVSNMDFATEVRTDRLALLWKVTMALALLLVWIAFLLQGFEATALLLSATAIMLGCWLTHFALQQDQYPLAVWCYVSGGLGAAIVPLVFGNEDLVRITPFVFPLIVVATGLLLSPVHTLAMFVLTTLVTIFVPYAATESFAFLGIYQAAAIGVSLACALLSAQVTGELYQITDWALLNYQRERRTSSALFESRQALEKSLMRSEVLGEQLQETNTQLEAAKHFRGQFLANMSHELRTPLNAIIGFSETMLSFPMMYDDVTLPEPYRHDMGQIHTSGQQLLTVINDILDLSKVDAGKLEVRMNCTDLKPIIDGVISTATGLVRDKDIELKSDLPTPLPDVYADETRVRQVLLNLYSNAAKFTESGYILLQVRQVAEGVRISVQDTGSGVSSDAQALIFEEFRQAETKGRDPRAGAGLGLAISRRLLELMDGRIWVESQPGKGSTFHFLLQTYDPAKHGDGAVVKTTGRAVSKIKAQSEEKTS